MSWQVFKFGGSSLGGAGRLERVCALIERATGPRVAVVVSALGESTDWLISATRNAANGDAGAAAAELDRVEALAHTAARDVLAGDARSTFEREVVALLSPVRRLQRRRGPCCSWHPASVDRGPGCRAEGCDNWK